MAIYDVRGQRIRTLHDGTLVAGFHEMPWNGRDDTGRDVASGVYFARIEADGRVATRRMTMVK